MKLYQKTSTSSIKTSSGILRVDKDMFSELIEQTADSYKFKLTFKIALNNLMKDPRDYDKVVVTVKNKDAVQNVLNSNVNVSSAVKSLVKTSTVTTSLAKTQISPLLTQSNLTKTVISPLKPQNGLLTAKLPEKTANKLFVGIKMIEEIKKKEDCLSQDDVYIASHIADTYQNMFTYTEAYVSKMKSKKIEQVVHSEILNSNILQRNYASANLSSVDPGFLIPRINNELYDITTPAIDDNLSNLTSESLLDSVVLKRGVITSGKPQLSRDITKYFLHEVKKSPQEDSSKSYEKQRVTKRLDHVDISTDVYVKKSNKNLNLSVRFDLFKRYTNVVDETVTVDLYVPSHVEAFDAIVIPPVLKISKLPMIAGTMNLRSSGDSHIASIEDRERPGKVKKFNVYLKNISDRGIASGYKLLGTVVNNGNAKIDFKTRAKLSVVRAVPVDAQNKESNVFTSVVVGPGHDSVGNLTIVVNNKGNNQIKIDAFNVPKKSVSLTLYKRDCTDNIDDKFRASYVMKCRKDSSNASFIDSNVLPDRTYEYYVVALEFDKDRTQEVPVFSNFVLYKNLFNNVTEKSIDVSLSDANTSVSSTGEFSVSFKLDTSITQTENEKITNLLKTQIPEIYAQYLDPIANSSSPLGDDVKGVPQYRSLFFHEVVRTNLNTGDRETFDLVGDGTFFDSPETRRIYNVKRIDPQNAYYYQVFTYMKNPIELFKKFVARGVDAKGKEWFYRPYKWRNASSRIGVLYPDGADGIPVIDAYNVFTSESRGMTASYRVDGSTQYTSITQIAANRVDRNTVKLTWNYQSTYSNVVSSLYDSFVVMKVVNGIRAFVGRTIKNYIYHELTEEDVGSVYYIVVPIMNEYDIDEPAYSNILLVTPDGLTSKIRVVSKKIPEQVFSVEKNKFDLSNADTLNSKVSSLDSMKSMITDVFTKKELAK